MIQLMKTQSLLSMTGFDVLDVPGALQARSYDRQGRLVLVEEPDPLRLAGAERRHAAHAEGQADQPGHERQE